MLTFASYWMLLNIEHQIEWIELLKYDKSYVSEKKKKSDRVNAIADTVTLKRKVSSWKKEPNLLFFKRLKFNRLSSLIPLQKFYFWKPLSNWYLTCLRSVGRNFFKIIVQCSIHIGYRHPLLPNTFLFKSFCIRLDEHRTYQIWKDVIIFVCP